MNNDSFALAYSIEEKSNPVIQFHGYRYTLEKDLRKVCEVGDEYVCW